MGRQGINIDNQRYVGTVGWRQSMQTDDDAGVTWAPNENLEVCYGFIWQVIRIFGSDVIGPPLTTFEGSSHVFNEFADRFPWDSRRQPQRQVCRHWNHGRSGIKVSAAYHCFWDG